jgi:hypothetical protein
MKYLLIGLAVLLSGCSTTAPVVAKFPEKPKFSEACPQLQKLNDSAKLSDVSTTVNVNYSAYYECAMKVDTWRDWYEIQKRIYESVK